MKSDLDVVKTTGVAEFAADVIVVGGGGAGLAAAIEAVHVGRKVILIEKNAHLGGATIKSVGSFSATCTRHQIRKGIKDNPEDHFEDLGKFNDLVKKYHYADSDNEDNLELRRLLVYSAGETLRWLESMGVRFFGPVLEKPHRRPRMHNVLPNSTAYGYWLEKKARAVGVKIYTERRAIGYLMDGERVRGVECLNKAGERENYVAAGGVVLSCGDYSASEELKGRYAKPQLVTMKTSCNPTNTGDGHLMSLPLGARIVNPHMINARVRFIAPRKKHFLQRIPPWRPFTKFMELAFDFMPDWLLRPFIMSFLTTVLEAQPSLFKDGAILVNERGERFSDEKNHPELKLVDQPNHQAYMIFDERLAKKYSTTHYVSTAPGVAYAYIPDYARSRKDIFYKSPTIDGLARLIGVDAATLARHISLRNEEIKSDSASRATPIETGPFYAMGPVSCFVKGTDAGLAVNRQFQILGHNDVPIPGLYGAGNLAQSLMLEGHGNHLNWAFTSGRMAGRNAAYLANTAQSAR